jgi:hypothetical protein
MRTLLLLAAALTLLVSACKVEVNQSLAVNEDGSGSFSAEVGFDEEFRQLMEGFGEGELDLEEGFGSGTEFPGGETYERSEGEFTYYGATFEFDDIEELEEFIDGAGGSEVALESFSFELDDEGAAMRAVIAAEDIAGEEGGLGLEGFDPSQITEDFFSVNYIVAMPGTVTKHNANEVLFDGRLRWSIPITGATLEAFAESEFGGSSLWWIWLIVGIVLIAGLGALIGALIGSRRASQQAVAAAGSQQPAPPPETTAEATAEAPVETTSGGSEGEAAPTGDPAP